jgi:hypothetical protein
MAPTLLDSVSMPSYVLVAGVAAMAFSVLNAIRFFHGKWSRNGNPILMTLS